jgi:hypothetical protein
MDLEELWALQEGQAPDDMGREMVLVVPEADPEFGPYTGYAFIEPGDEIPTRMRLLTQDEVSEATGEQLEEPE